MTETLLTVLDDVGTLMVSCCVDPHWETPSPCDDWNLGQVVDHVIGGNRFSVAILDGRTAADAMQLAIESFDDAPDRAESLSLSLDEQLRAFATGTLDRQVDHVVTPMAARDALTMRLHDLIVHTWDVGESQSPGFRLHESLVEWSLGDLQDNPATLTTFGLNPLDKSVSGRPHERLLSLFGRQISG